VFDGGLSGSMQVGQAKDIPLMERRGENTHTHIHTHTHTHTHTHERRHTGSCGEAEDKACLVFAVKREMNKTIE